MSRYKVYIENRAIEFVSPEEASCEAECVQVAAQEVLHLTKLLQKLQFTKRIQVISTDIDRVFTEFQHALPFIEAGGGLVVNPSGEVLMIFRNDRWDLPKGKLEPGEAIEACAVREVSEECALPESELQRGAWITYTYHCYRIRGEWVLKRTCWYHMQYTGATQPQPQTIEGITRVEWIARDRVAELLRGTYYTICDVFHAAGYLQ
ncbi:MAG: NUDIX domain-containing protein [Alistipes sp.]|nr:NUDIX domain-containing protein [Alistipes sp.]